MHIHDLNEVTNHAQAPARTRVSDPISVAKSSDCTSLRIFVFDIDEETMTQWYDFVKWCYAQDGECNAESEIKENPSFNFEISPLMEDAMNECDGWWCKYNVDHQQIAEEEFKEDCGNCDGVGYMDEDCENECETCEGSGKDPEDEDGHWFYYEEAFSNISNSVDTSCFEKLSKIVL